MAKAVKLFVGSAFKLSHTQELALSEHGSWWSRITNASGRATRPWQAVSPPKKPYYEGVYGPIVEGSGTWVFLTSKTLSLKAIKELPPGTVQGQACPLKPMDLKSYRTVLPTTPEEAARVAEAKAIGGPIRKPKIKRRTGGPL